MPKKTTVLYVEEGVAFGGSLVVIANLIRCLDNQAFRAVVVGEMDRDIMQYHLAGGAKLYIIRHVFNYVHWSKATRVLQVLRNKILKKTCIYFLSALRTTVNYWYGARLFWVALRERVDLVHINNGVGSFHASLVAYLLRKKYIFHVHGLGPVTPMSLFFVKAASKVVAISEYVRSDLERAGIPKDKIIVIPNPVLPRDLMPGSRQRVRERFQVEPGARIFGIFGRIVRWKGQMEFLKAAELVLKAVPGSVAFIVGDPSDGAKDYLYELQQFIKERGIEERVVFTGYVNDVAELYAMMDVVVHTSVTPEPFGLVITEAMAYGVPVIASTLGAPPEIVDHGQDGYLIHPENTEELARQLIALLKDDMLRTEMGRRGREKVLVRYDAKTYASRFEGLYRESCAE